jgi:heme/copper-type cytochrome/quinol oxidase subunit 2
MEAVFLKFLGVATLVLLTANAPIDVAPPAPVLAGLALGVIAMLGVLLIVIILVAFLVIRRIKKRRSNRERP